MYYESLERRLKLKAAMDSFEKGFDEFAEKHHWGRTSDPHMVLTRIRYFLHKNGSLRKKLFFGTVLNGTDCVVNCALGVSLAGRKGIDARIAIPRNPAKSLHTMIVYSDKGKIKYFRMSGRKEYSSAKIINPAQVHGRLRLIRPFLDLAHNARDRIKKRRGK